MRRRRSRSKGRSGSGIQGESWDRRQGGGPMGQRECRSGKGGDHRHESRGAIGLRLGVVGDDRRERLGGALRMLPRDELFR